MGDARSTAGASDLLLRCRYVVPENVRPEIAKVFDDLFVTRIRDLSARDVQQIAWHAFRKIDLVLVPDLRRPVVRARKRYEAIALLVVLGLFDVDRIFLGSAGQRGLILQIPYAVLNEPAEEKADVVDGRPRALTREMCA